jgi:predicted MFS family arabinose efflux permease
MASRSDRFVLFTLVVAMTLLGLEQIQRANLSALPTAGGVLAAGLVALVLLARHENRMPSPLIPLGLLRQPAIWHSDAMTACHGAALVSLITFLPVYLEVVRRMSPSTTGLLLVPLTFGIGAGSLITGHLVNRTGLTAVFPVIGLALVTANLVIFAFWASALGAVALAGLFLWNGVFMGTVMGVVQVTVQTASGALRLGEAAASVQFSRSIGAAFGTALVSTALFAALSFKNPQAAGIFGTMVEQTMNMGRSPLPGAPPHIQADIANAFRAAFLAIAAFTLAGFFLALTNPSRRI